MKKYLRLLVLLTIAFCSKINATEIIGGSLRYEALGNQKYKIIGIINRNCGGTPLSIPKFSIYSKNAGDSLMATRTSIKDITHYCKTDTPVCKPSNTKNTDGVEQHTFEAIVDFSVYPYKAFYDKNECVVFFSMEACCRSSKTTNITANKFYLEAMLNLCALGNSSFNTSPVISSSPFVSMCNNLPFAYNFGCYDRMDVDSLTFIMSTPKKSRDSFERFISPYSLRYPIKTFFFKSTPLPYSKPPRGLFFDSLDGDLILTPMDTTNGAVIDIRIEEFRKINNTSILIGFCTMEVYITVKNCPANNPPSIPTANKWGVCEGDKLCFVIKSADARSSTQSKDDTTTLTWNYAIPNATFTIIDPTAREKEAKFCWQTNFGDARTNPYQFTVYAKDDNCDPSPSTIAKGFLITVKPKAQSLRQYDQPVCGKIIFRDIPTDTATFKGTHIYEWSIRDSSNSGGPLYKSFKQKDSFIFTKKGVYIVTHVLNNNPVNCPNTYVDTIHIYCVGGGVNIQSLISQNTLRIYPNPTNGFITFDIKRNLHYTEMKLINNIGQIIYTGPVVRTFDMSGFAKGIYIFEINSNEGKYSATIVKE